MTVRAQNNKHPLAIFLGASVAIGWAVTILAALFVRDAALVAVIAIPVSFVPALVALVVLRITGTGDERAALRRRLTTLRGGWVWYAAALLVGPVIHAGGVAIAMLTGGTFPLHAGMLALLPLFLITSLGEEIGWRGYALPKLQERYGRLSSALMLGVVWAAFHWLALAANAEAPLAYVAIGTANLVALSVIISFVFNEARQSLPIVILLHAAYNTVSIGVIPLGGTGVPLVAFALTSGIAWIVALGTVAYRRQGSPSTRTRDLAPLGSPE